MNRAICRVTLIVLTATAAGCATPRHQRGAASGRNVFASLQAAVVEASETARESVAQTVDPSNITRVEAWIGGDEYSARVVKSDRQLGMTVLKVDVDEPVKALNIDTVEDPRIGDRCVGVQPSGADSSSAKTGIFSAMATSFVVATEKTLPKQPSPLPSF